MPYLYFTFKANASLFRYNLLLD